MIAEITRYQGIIADKDDHIKTLIQHIDWLYVNLWKLERRVMKKQLYCHDYTFDYTMKYKHQQQLHNGTFDYFPAHWFDDPPRPTPFPLVSTPSIQQLLEQIAQDHNLAVDQIIDAQFDSPDWTNKDGVWSRKGHIEYRIRNNEKKE